MGGIMRLRDLGLGPAVFVWLAISSCDNGKPLGPNIEAAATAAGGSAPAAPSNATSSAVAWNQIAISWQDNSSNEAGFEVYRSNTSNGPFSLQFTAAPNVKSFADGGLTAATQYCYLVRAFRTTGSKTSYSAFSNTACATTPAPPAPPTPPFDLSAEAYPWMIALMWVPTSTDHDGFIIERCAGVVCSDSDFVVIATTVKVAQGYSDYYAAWGATYTYRVRAFNSGGASTPSNEASATACYVLLADDGTYYCSTTPQ